MFAAIINVIKTKLSRTATWSPPLTTTDIKKKRNLISSHDYDDDEIARQWGI